MAFENGETWLENRQSEYVGHIRILVSPQINTLSFPGHFFRFHKLVWGPFGMGGPREGSAGLLVGGTDNGIVTIYNANKILSGEKDDLVFAQTDKHTGRNFLDGDDE